eukprot:gene31549-6735_t
MSTIGSNGPFPFDRSDDANTKKTTARCPPSDQTTRFHLTGAMMLSSKGTSQHKEDNSKMSTIGSNDPLPFDQSDDAKAEGNFPGPTTSNWNADLNNWNTDRDRWATSGGVQHHFPPGHDPTALPAFERGAIHAEGITLEHDIEAQEEAE